MSNIEGLHGPLDVIRGILFLVINNVINKIITKILRLWYKNIILKEINI